MNFLSGVTIAIALGNAPVVNSLPQQFINQNPSSTALTAAKKDEVDKIFCHPGVNNDKLCLKHKAPENDKPNLYVTGLMGGILLGLGVMWWPNRKASSRKEVNVEEPGIKSFFEGGKEYSTVEKNGNALGGKIHRAPNGRLFLDGIGRIEYLEEGKRFIYIGNISHNNRHGFGALSISNAFNEFVIRVENGEFREDKSLNTTVKIHTGEISYYCINGKYVDANLYSQNQQ